MGTHDLWAKWADGQPSYALTAHLIDTACFAEALIDDWLPRVACASAARLLGTDRAGMRNIVVAAAGLHDLGKCNPVFQGQLASPRRSSEGFDTWFAATGLPRPPTPIKQATHIHVRRHEVCSAVWLADDPLPGHTGVASLVAGHHGVWRIPDLDEIGEPAEIYEWLRSDPQWSAAADSIRRTVTQVCDLTVHEDFDSVAAVPVLTGLVVLADWLASALADARSSLDEPLGGSWSEHRDATREIAALQVTDLLGAPVVPDGAFAGAFPFIDELRPVQTALLDPGPVGLRIVAVPTGDGKTEAALGRWLTASAGRGLFFGLPTMATADAMFTRVSAMFEGTDVFGALAHGRSTLNEFYAPARIESFEARVGHATTETGMRPSSWLVGSRRAMLAPVTIGTTDQLLLSVVRHRFGFLRLLGAVAKTVVLDEVHSYDPYMARVLERFLEWAGRWRIDVVLLSATLPAERLRAYVSAYGGDPTDAQVVYPSVTTVQADGGSTSTRPLEGSGRGRTVKLECVVTDDVVGEIVDRVVALRSAHPDAKIGVIFNTVARCQQAGRQLAEARVGPLMVLHSRFTATRRTDDTHDAVARFGKESQSGPDLVVATQVAEQSMDLDLDMLLTELCPAPSLVQRPGRLHRHDLGDPSRNRSRPAGLCTPTMVVVAPSDVEAAQPLPWPFYPYTVAEMLRTWQVGLVEGGLRALSVPDDVQDFIDRSHLTLDELADPSVGGSDHALAHLLDEAATRATARDRLVPSPEDVDDDRYGESLTSWCKAPDGVQPSARLIDDRSVQIVLYDPGTEGSLPHRPTRQQILELLDRTVPCPHRMLDRLPDEAVQSHPAGWERTALADVRIVDVTLRPTLVLDPLLGLIPEEDVR